MLDARFVLARRHLLQGAAVEVFAALDDAGIDSMLLKGESIARVLYPPDEPRLMRDVDILVQRSDLVRTQELLRALAFEPVSLPAGASAHDHELDAPSKAWRRGAGSTVVEVDLHTSFHGVTVDDQDLWGCWRSQAGEMPLRERTVAVPSAASTSLIVALHRNRSPDGTAAARDLELAMAATSFDVWSAAARQARQLGCESTMTAGLLLHPDGRDLLTRLGLSTTLSRREELLHDQKNALAVGWYDWSQIPGRGARWRRLWQEFWPSAAGLRLMHPYAARGRRQAAAARVHRVVHIVHRSPKAMAQAFRPRAGS